MNEREYNAWTTVGLVIVGLVCALVVGSCAIEFGQAILAR